MENDLNKYLGLRVRSLRENAQMTQEELANVCDVSWRTISNLERGCVTPDLVMICKISKKFNVGLDDLLNIEVQRRKSMSRIATENLLIERIKTIDDPTLDFVVEQLNVVFKYFGAKKESMRIRDQLILLRKILSFAAIAKTGNVTAAALENGMKQSNLSGYVKELEEKVGAKLFEHGDRRMILTEVGKNLYEISCSIEKSVYKINSYKQQNNNVSGAVRLWTSDGLAAAYLSSCLPGFYQLYPDVRIEILCSIEAPSVLYDADLAVVYEKPVHPDAVILFKHNLRFGLFASMDYLASFGYPKDIEDIQKNHRLCVRSNYREVWGEWCNFVDNCSYVAAETNSSSMLMQLTKDGIGIALHPFSVGLKEKNLVCLDKIKFELSHPFWIVSYKDVKDQEKIRVLIDYIKKATAVL